MRTAEEILRDNLGEDLYNELDQSFIYPQPTGKFPITDLLKDAINEARKEAIKECAEKATAFISVNDEPLVGKGSILKLIDEL